MTEEYYRYVSPDDARENARAVAIIDLAIDLLASGWEKGNLLCEATRRIDPEFGISRIIAREHPKNKDLMSVDERLASLQHAREWFA